MNLNNAINETPSGAPCKQAERLIRANSQDGPSDVSKLEGTKVEEAAALGCLHFSLKTCSAGLCGTSIIDLDHWEIGL